MDIKRIKSRGRMANGEPKKSSLMGCSVFLVFAQTIGRAFT